MGGQAACTTSAKERARCTAHAVRGARARGVSSVRGGKAQVKGQNTWDWAWVPMGVPNGQAGSRQMRSTKQKQHSPEAAHKADAQKRATSKNEESV